MKKIPLFFIFVSLFIFSGCGGEQPTETSAKGEARQQLSRIFPNASDNFLEVATHLDIGGPVLVYLDMEENLRDFAQFLDHELMPLIREYGSPMIPEISVEPFMDTLHLTGLQAVGMSSVRDGEYYRNRTVLYLPEGRQGLFRFFGDEEVTLQNARRVPHYSLVFAEMEMAPGTLYETIEESIVALLGEPFRPMLETQLETAFRDLPGNFEDWHEGLPHSLLFYLYKSQEGETVEFEGVEIPQLHFVGRISRMGAPLESFLFPRLVSSEGWTVKEEDGFNIYSPPTMTDSWQPVFIVQGRDLYLTDSVEEFTRFTEGAYARNHLAQSGNFREIRQRLPDNMKSFYYVSPRFTDMVEAILPQAQKEIPEDERPFVEFTWSTLLKNFPRERPIYGGHFNRPTSITFLSVGPRSHKGTLTSLTGANPMVLGTLSAIAIPAYSRVRETSGENMIMNNLRQLGGAANMHYLDTGQTSVSASELVGPDKFIQRINQIHREQYGAGRGAHRDTPASPSPQGDFSVEDFEIREDEHNYLYAEDPLTGKVLYYTF
ncbi:MAG: hypothetical protein LAT58_13170 [Opitutales bacterium]|nr:hypothetical protein [Opitutales bacterium]